MKFEKQEESVSMKGRIGVRASGNSNQLVKTRWRNRFRRIWLRGLIDRQKVRLWVLIGRWRLWQLRGW
ncbi:MAG: hypothetical protein AAFZ17_20340 [Cyanobacteria bacterium J06650_10]